MSLISVANLKTYSDILANIYNRMATNVGLVANVAAPVVGNDQYLVDKLLDLVVGLADYQQINDLSSNIYAVLQKTDRKNRAKTLLTSLVGQLNDHCSARGSSVADSIVDLTSYLNYYNGGSGGLAFSSLMNPVFGDMYYDLFNTRLPSNGLFHPGIHPTLDATYTNGMGIRAVGGSFTAGSAYNSTPLYAELAPLLEVTTDFADGTGAPTFTIAGTDNTGATSVTWTGTGAGNNPASALSTTITPAVNAMAIQTVAFASGTGVQVGSVLTINSGLVDEEVIVVTGVSTNDITAYFAKAHDAGAAVTGKTSIVLTPGTANRRLRSVSGITIGVTGHSAGAVRVIGIQDRSYAGA